MATPQIQDNVNGINNEVDSSHFGAASLSLSTYSGSAGSMYFYSTNAKQASKRFTDWRRIVRHEARVLRHRQRRSKSKGETGRRRCRRCSSKRITTKDVETQCSPQDFIPTTFNLSPPSFEMIDLGNQLRTLGFEDNSAVTRQLTLLSPPAFPGQPQTNWISQAGNKLPPAKTTSTNLFSSPESPALLAESFSALRLLTPPLETTLENNMEESEANLFTAYSNSFNPALPKRNLQECQFCKSNGERWERNYSHTLRNEKKEIVCPVFSRYICPKCGKTGKEAHTLRNCPLLGKKSQTQTESY